MPDLTEGGASSLLAQLQTAVSAVSEAAGGGMDPPDAAAALTALEKIQGDLRTLAAALKSDLIQQTKRGKFTMGGLLVVRASDVKRSEWDHAGIVAEIGRASDAHELVYAREILPLCSISYWKHGRHGEPGLFSDWGIDRDQFCKVERTESVSVSRIPEVTS